MRHFDINSITLRKLNCCAQIVYGLFIVISLLDALKCEAIFVLPVKMKDSRMMDEQYLQSGTCAVMGKKENQRWVWILTDSVENAGWKCLCESSAGIDVLSSGIRLYLSVREDLSSWFFSRERERSREGG